MLDIAVTPDRSYCLSIRGIAREAATAYGVAFHDPAGIAPLPVDGSGHPGEIADPTGADRLVLRTVTGLDPTAGSPVWLQRRLVLCGMRPVSLAVDITNYVMLETGQPLHAFDRTRLSGPIVVRRAAPGERLETLDHVVRDLDPEDLLITDGSGPIGLAGAMGGLTTEIDSGSTELVLEAAHFDAVAVARATRRHKLTSEAAKRFERGVDPELGPVASTRAVQLLTELGGASHAGSVEVRHPRAPVVIQLDPARPGRTAGLEIPADTVARHLEQVGASVDRSGPTWSVTPPTWRPDLTDPADLDEEVIRLVGYDSVPALLPLAPAGPGFSDTQRLRRRIGQALAHAGLVEAPSYPFVGEEALDGLGLPADDDRRNALRLANPLSDEEPLLRTTLLPGLLSTLRRNLGRGNTDVSLFELAPVFRPGPAELPEPPRPRARPPADGRGGARARRRPAGPALAGGRRAVGGARPARLVGSRAAGRLAGRRRARPGGGRAGEGRRLTVTADQHAPWHPGRCAALHVDGRLVGHAGELHPRVVAAFGLPDRTCAMELDLDAARGRPRPGAGAADLDLPGRHPGRRARRRRPGHRPPRWRRPCGTAAGSCSSRCGCSTSTGAARWGRAGPRSPSPCASGHRTARSPPRRRAPRARPPWPRRRGAPAPSSVPDDGGGALRGQVALVSGAGRGIGRAMALGLAGDGASIGAARAEPRRRSTPCCASARRSARRRSPCRPTSPTARRRRRPSRRCERDLGPVDLLVTNAGQRDRWPRCRGRPTRTTGGAPSRPTCAGPTCSTASSCPGWSRAGAAGCCTSAAGWASARNPDWSAYAVSKAAVSRLTDTLAAALDGTGVTLLEVSPGLVRTDMTETMWGPPDEQPWNDVARVVEVVRRFAAGDLDALHGRFVHAARDDVDALVALAGRVRETDARTLRLRAYGPEDPLA